MYGTENRMSISNVAQEGMEESKSISPAERGTRDGVNEYWLHPSPQSTPRAGQRTSMGGTRITRPRTTGSWKRKSQQHQGSRQVCVSPGRKKCWTMTGLDQTGFKASKKKAAGNNPVAGKIGPPERPGAVDGLKSHPDSTNRQLAGTEQKDGTNQREAHGQSGARVFAPSVQSSGQSSVPSDVVPSNVAAGGDGVGLDGIPLEISTHQSIHPGQGQQAGRQAGKPNPKKSTGDPAISRPFNRSVAGQRLL
ncbi:hypothetical protein HDK90DRAFT_14195 [Phyllosticta capitalensis]|uniref:Uncharacterized protein n=1 Tax=Phyllosticta capitalensis TaxID=121624 RepID=A0ABR1Z2C7_9PEZI